MSETLTRIESALTRARAALAKFTPGQIEADKKAGGDPVTAADTEIDDILKQCLPREGEGWLSEETVDEPSRLGKKLVWIVDPLDGTKEFVMGIPEWCVSIGLVEDGVPVAGGILNPVTDELFLGEAGRGVTLNGKRVEPTAKSSLEGATVLASRSEMKRGEWDRFESGPVKVIPSGSVAYKLARIAAGLDDATWTLVPKNEWDLAGGVALLHAAGGVSRDLDWKAPVFNRPDTLYRGLVASGSALIEPIGSYLGLSS